MNTLVYVTYLVLIIFIVLRYESKDEPGLILSFRLMGMGVCLGIPVYYMLTEEGIFSDLVIVLIGVVSFAVYNFLFSEMLSTIKKNVNKQMIDAAVNTEANKRAVVIVSERDDDEFERMRSKQLGRVVAQDFEKKLANAVESDANEKVQEKLSAFADGKDMAYAIWIGLHGAGEVLGCQHANDEVLAIPYWIEYQVGRGAIVRRYITNCATVKKLSDVDFMSKRWSKVEGQNAFVVDGALISGVN